MLTRLKVSGFKNLVDTENGIRPKRMGAMMHADGRETHPSQFLREITKEAQ